MLTMHCNYPTKSNVVKEILLKEERTKCWMQGNPKLNNFNSEMKLRPAKLKALIALFLIVERTHNG